MLKPTIFALSIKTYYINGIVKPDGQIKQKSPQVLVFLLLQVSPEVQHLPTEHKAEKKASKLQMGDKLKEIKGAFCYCYYR